MTAQAAQGGLFDRSGKGAYLHDAIRSEYGSPKGFELVHQREQEKQLRSLQAVRQQARISLAEAFRADYKVYLGERLVQMPLSQPDAFAGFLAQEETERRKLRTFCTFPAVCLFQEPRFVTWVRKKSLSYALQGVSRVLSHHLAR